MLQASICDGCSLDALSLGEDCLSPAEVDVGGGQIAQALMIADVAIVLDEARDLGFEIAGPRIPYSPVPRHGWRDCRQTLTC
jgi:hypothetical protein